MPLGISKKRKTFKFKKPGQPIALALPSLPKFSKETEPEMLMGEVDGFQASAPEERLARALRKKNLQFQFRMTVGAPRGLPGWKELDFIVWSSGMLYAVEVDTAFTHRQKENADVLHDAIILNDPELQAMGTFYPKVFHADGDHDLADLFGANRWVTFTFR